MKKIICLSILSLFILTGCAQLNLNEFKNPFDSLLTSGDGEKSPTNKGGSPYNQRGNFSFNVKEDVDIVFASIKSDFGFKSPDEIRNKEGLDADFHLMDVAYHYDVNPGSYYRLGYGYLKQKKVDDLIMDIKIQKISSGTKISATYKYEGNNANIKNDLINRIKSSIN